MTNHFGELVNLPASIDDSTPLISLHMANIELGFLEDGLIVGSDGISTSNFRSEQRK